MRIRPFRFFNIFIVLILMFGLGVTTALAGTMYVKSAKTKMTAEASARSKTVGYLSAGQAVNVVGEEGRFTKVSVGGKEGYVFKFKLTSSAPSGGGGGGGLDALTGSQKMAANESSSGSSIRGLSPISENYAKGHGISADHVNSVKQMESFSVSESQIDAFQEQGELGPYAK